MLLIEFQTASWKFTWNTYTRQYPTYLTSRYLQDAALDFFSDNELPSCMYNVDGTSLLYIVSLATYLHTTPLYSPPLHILARGAVFQLCVSSRWDDRHHVLRRAQCYQQLQPRDIGLNVEWGVRRSLARSLITMGGTSSVGHPLRLPPTGTGTLPPGRKNLGSAATTVRPTAGTEMSLGWSAHSAQAIALRAVLRGTYERFVAGVGDQPRQPACDTGIACGSAGYTF
ncbi:uncharacterized protein SEPMUDRAFT_104728 [Sphaerulina musiva SO2202]|uniref:Uncharacterized protein n=1 Tax=Sphaerulina musiva (strain SO2202) TaxID=692275 RepID=N1QJV1_SPHMS|nr:uncharacterized protein SEPMUDRAFT_104728 [Sphaerulina musiva SO2202]EMF17480.1 hypothetical protein SEPMUDRAFT_104728 [Sphaerulina musiva SO2202]